MPIQTGVIPEDFPDIDSPDTFAEQYQAYLLEIPGSFTLLESDDFTPTLDTLDTLSRSITVKQ